MIGLISSSSRRARILGLAQLGDRDGRQNILNTSRLQNDVIILGTFARRGCFDNGSLLLWWGRMGGWEDCVFVGSFGPAAQSRYKQVLSTNRQGPLLST